MAAFSALLWPVPPRWLPLCAVAVGVITAGGYVVAAGPYLGPVETLGIGALILAMWLAPPAFSRRRAGRPTPAA